MLILRSSTNSCQNREARTVSTTDRLGSKPPLNVTRGDQYPKRDQRVPGPLPQRQGRKGLVPRYRTRNARLLVEEALYRCRRAPVNGLRTRALTVPDALPYIRHVNLNAIFVCELPEDDQDSRQLRTELNVISDTLVGCLLLRILLNSYVRK